MDETSGYVPVTVLVTGASAGFGAAIARSFAVRGSRVVLVARRSDRIGALADQLGRSATFPVALDICDREAVEQAIAALPRRFAEIDCLVNNAGLALGTDPAQAADLANWDRMIDTNCKGLAYVTRALLPGMVERGRGHVINIGSVAATCAYPGGNVYGASKAFVRQLSANLRSDLHGTGIRVTCVEPGMSGGTEFSDVRFGGDRGRVSAVYAGVDTLTPEDVAEAVIWAATLPRHANVDFLEVTPVAQSRAGFQFHRHS